MNRLSTFTWPKGPALAAGLGVFALGLLCGWSTGNGRNLSESHTTTSSTASATTDEPPAGSAQNEHASKVEFFGRLNDAFAIHNKTRRKNCLFDAVEALDPKEFRGVLEQLRSARFAERQEVIAALFSRWGEIDPKAALAYAAELKGAPAHEAAIAILRGWLDHDAAGAESWILQQPDGPVKKGAMASLIQVVAGTNRAHALELAMASPIAFDASELAADSIFFSWTQTNPKEAATAAAQLPEGTLKTASLQIVAEQWAHSHPTAAADWAMALPRLYENQQFADIGAMSITPMTGVLKIWTATDDGPAMLNWLSQIPDGRQKVTVITNALSYEVEDQQDVAMVEKLAALYPDVKSQAGILIRCADRLALHDPAGTVAWVEGLGDDSLERQMLPGMMQRLSGDSLQSALQEIERLNATGETQVPLKSLTFWPGAEPNVLADWAVRQPNNQSYVQTVARAWLRYDQGAAVNWINTLPAAARTPELQKLVDGGKSGAAK